jgi:phosphatidylglycerol---prolipoprotein diacylglyceryl transferase
MYPRLLHIYGPLWIQTYGAMIALGFLTFIFLTLRHPYRAKLISKEQYLNTVFLGLASGIIGARLLFIVTNPGAFSENPLEVFYPWIGGFVVLGSIIGILIAVPFFLRWIKVPILPLMDLAALYAPLMQAISRIGCFCAGCCYGAPAINLWWAVTFTNPLADAPLNVPLHPAQLYTSLASFLIFLILKKNNAKRMLTPGATLFSYLILENSARFITDFWRGDRDLIAFSPLNDVITISTVQGLSLIGILLSFVGLAWVKYKHH